MNEFILMVFGELRHAIVQLLAALFIAGAVVAYIYWKYYRGRKPFPWKKLLQWGLLLSYLFVVSYALWGRQHGLGASGTSLHLFRSLREAWNRFSVTAWLNIFLNIALLIPFGILVPAFFPKTRAWWKMLLNGVLFTLYLETTQFLTGRGIFDVDDLMHNTVGVIMGYALYSGAYQIWTRPPHWGRKLACSCLVLAVPIASFGAVFALYARQPFGNLSIAPTFQVDTSEMQWELSCSLPDSRETVPIYRLNRPTLSHCMALADTLEQGLGLSFDPVRTQIYDESLSFWDGPHSLVIQRADGSFRYHMVEDALLDEPAETERSVLEALLAELGLEVPEGADFSYTNSGFHRFTADQLTTEDGMADGTVCCQYRANHVISELEYRMHRYADITDSEIISPAEAYDRLRDGRFLEIPGVLESGDPGRIGVLDCKLTYEIDSKGFRMPVYVFTLDCGETTAQAAIPAQDSPSWPPRLF